MVELTTKQTKNLRAHQMAILEILKEFDRVCKKLDIPYVLFAGTLLGAVRHGGFVPWDDDVDILMHRRHYERFLKEAESVLDTERFYLQKEFSEHWPMFFSKLRLNNTACIEKFHPKDPKIHQGIYMDIFPCDNALNSRIGRTCQFLASKVVIAKSLDRRGYDTNSFTKRIFMTLCRLLPMKPFLRLTKAGKEDGERVHNFLGGAHSFTKSVYARKLFKNPVEARFEDGMYPVPGGYEQLLQILYDDYMEIPCPEERKLKQHAVLVDTENSYEQYLDYRDGMKFDIYTRSIR